MTFLEFKKEVLRMRKNGDTWFVIANTFGTYHQRIVQMMKTADKLPSKLVPSDILSFISKTKKKGR